MDINLNQTNAVIGQQNIGAGVTITNGEDSTKISSFSKNKELSLSDRVNQLSTGLKDLGFSDLESKILADYKLNDKVRTEFGDSKGLQKNLINLIFMTFDSHFVKSLPQEHHELWHKISLRTVNDKEAVAVRNVATVTDNLIDTLRQLFDIKYEKLNQ